MAHPTLMTVEQPGARRWMGVVASLALGAGLLVAIPQPAQASVVTSPVNYPITVANCKTLTFDQWINEGDTVTLTFDATAYAVTGSYCMTASNTSQAAVGTISPALPATNYTAIPNGTTTITAVGAGTFNYYFCDANTGCGGMVRFFVRKVPYAPAVPTVTLNGTTATIGAARGDANPTGGTYDPASFTVTAAPGGNTCSFTVSSGNTSCQISGLTPATAYTFTATATNSAGTSDPSSASTSVTPVGPAVLTASTPPTTGTTGTAYQYTFVATGYPAPTFSVPTGGSLPTGLTLDPVTGQLTGTPTAAGSYTFQVRATNAHGSDTSSPITITVGTPPPSPSGTDDAPRPAPAQTPTSTPSPVPTVSEAPSRVVDALDPIATTENPLIPSGGLPAGRSLLLLNGEPVPVRVAPNAQRQPTALVVEAPGLTMRLEGRGDSSDPLGLTSKQALILQSQPLLRARTSSAARSAQPVARSSGDGFRAASAVKFYLLPDTLLGTLTTDGGGAYAGDVPIPAGIAPGVYTLQVNGYAPDGSVRSLSLGVKVESTIASTKPVTVRATVRFASMSVELTDAAKAQLRQLVNRAGARTQGVTSIGYVQASGDKSNDQSLSTRRARTVADHLRSLGVTGSFIVRGDGIGGYDSRDRKVVVTISQG